MPDLMAALEASLAAAKTDKAKQPAKPASKRAGEAANGGGRPRSRPAATRAKSGQEPSALASKAVEVEVDGRRLRALEPRQGALPGDRASPRAR